MTKYLIRRLAGIIPTLLIIVTLGFFVIRIAPGGPFASEKTLPPAVLANVLAKYHLDEPLLKQYARYMLDVPDEFHARFSATGRRYTFRLVARRAPVTHRGQEP